MKKMFSLLISLVLILQTFSLVGFSQTSRPFDIIKAENAYVEKLNQFKRLGDFMDAYFLDIYNNNCPILSIVLSYSNGYNSMEYEYKNGAVSEVSPSISISKYFTSEYENYVWSQGAIAYRGSSGGMRESFPVLGKDNMIYLVENSSIRVMNDVTRMFWIGYYDDGVFHKVYERYITMRSGSRASYTSLAYDKNGNSSFVDLPDADNVDAVLNYFGLTRIFENENSLKNKGSNPDKFTCIPSVWAQGTINEAIAYDIVPENLQHLYKNRITREDFCHLIYAMISRTQGKSLIELIEERGGYTLKEQPVIMGEEYKGLAQQIRNRAFSGKYIEICEQAGIINGYGDGNLAPYDFITRQQAAVILARTLEFLGFDSSNLEPMQFNDASSFASWATESIDLISACADKESNSRIMSGDASGNFLPNNNYTIEQAIITMKRMVDFLDVPIVRWLQNPNMTDTVSQVFGFTNKYSRCEIFDCLIAANDFEYSQADSNFIRYTTSTSAMLKDLMAYFAGDEGYFTEKEQRELIKQQLAEIISNITNENAAQNMAEIKIHNSVVAKMLKTGGKIFLETNDNKKLKLILDIYAKLENVIDWSNFSINQIEYAINDYVESLLITQTILDTLDLLDQDSEIVKAAVYDLREDYNGWWEENFREEIEEILEDTAINSVADSSKVDALLSNLLGKTSIYQMTLSLAVKTSSAFDHHKASESVMASLSYSNTFAEGFKYYAKKIVDENYTAQDVINCERLFALTKAAKINEYTNLSEAYTSLTNNKLEPYKYVDLRTANEVSMVSLSGADPTHIVTFLQKEILALKSLTY